MDCIMAAAKRHVLEGTALVGPESGAPLVLPLAAKTGTLPATTYQAAPLSSLKTGAAALLNVYVDGAREAMQRYRHAWAATSRRGGLPCRW